MKFKSERLKAVKSESIFKFKDVDSPNQPSGDVYLETQSKTSHLFGQEHALSNNKDLFLIFSICFVIGLIGIKTLYRKYLDQYIHSVFNFRYVFERAHDKNAMNIQFNLTMGFLSIFVTGLFLHIQTQAFGITIFEFSTIWNALLLVLTLGLFMLAKWFVNKLLGLIFKISGGLSDYHYVMQYYNKIMGIFLIPWILFWPYIPETWGFTYTVVGILMLIFFYFLRYLCAYRLIIDHRFSFFYTILYLCGLEILPLLVGFRYISK